MWLSDCKRENEGVRSAGGFSRGVRLVCVDSSGSVAKGNSAGICSGIGGPGSGQYEDASSVCCATSTLDPSPLENGRLPEGVKVAAECVLHSSSGGHILLSVMEETRGAWEARRGQRCGAWLISTFQSFAEWGHCSASCTLC